MSNGTEQSAPSNGGHITNNLFNNITMYYLNQKIEEVDGVYTTLLDGEHYVECDELKQIKKMIYAYDISGDLDFMYENMWNSEDEIEQEWAQMEYIQKQHDLYDEYRDCN